MPKDQFWDKILQKTFLKLIDTISNSCRLLLNKNTQLTTSIQRVGRDINNFDIDIF